MKHKLTGRFNNLVRYFSSVSKQASSEKQYVLDDNYQQGVKITKMHNILPARS
jgi:hypothetical protein